MIIYPRSGSFFIRLLRCLSILDTISFLFASYRSQAFLRVLLDYGIFPPEERTESLILFRLFGKGSEELFELLTQLFKNFSVVFHAYAPHDHEAISSDSVSLLPPGA